MDVARRQHKPQVSQSDWLRWADIPWLGRGVSGADVAQLALRILEGARQTERLTTYLREQLPEIASEFAVPWVGVVERAIEWDKVGEFGRQPLERLPGDFLAEALDRDAAGWTTVDAPGGASGWTLCAAPLLPGQQSSRLLVHCGRGMGEPSVSGLLVIARALGWGIEVAARHDRQLAVVDRLRATLRIASQLTLARETGPLLELIATEAARLLDADRSSIFIWDREHHEMVACPALGIEGNMLRLADSAGIVGECLKSGQAIRVDEAYADPRFDKQVDARSGYRTHNLLCVPLVDPAGERIGAFEVINKRQGRFTPEDETSLSELGIQAACALANTREREQLVRRHQQLTQVVTQGVEIIGESPAIVGLRSAIDRVAATELPVLILGESGTGKEVVAQALHYRGARREAPFVAVNCAAMAETLLESELFGHEKGAFTDAHEARPGKFELAEGGTLFLDEIGDLSPGGQAKLLRAVEQKVITRVGGSQAIRTNVRVVAATNVNLQAAVREKKFREDLYYRLSVVVLELPPLRDRPEDVLPLAEHFLSRFCRQAGGRKLSITSEARKRLQAHGWPGNIRELRNLMERVAFLCPREEVDSDDLEFILSPGGEGDDDSADGGLAAATERFQRDYIRRMIKRVKGNMSEASRVLGMHRSNLYRKMGDLGMLDSGERKRRRKEEG
ncbi:MAG: sigma-54 interaction domain-containing protein [Planctomycetales bacterium]